MAEQARIIVFEDQQKNFNLLAAPLRELLGDDFLVVQYDGNRKLTDPKKWAEAEDWIRDDLLKPSPAALAIIDWDLTQFEHPAPQQFIRGIAEDLAIPTVLYQSDANPGRQLERLKRWQERRIAVEGTQDQQHIAEECADVARGFRTIQQRVSELGDKPRLLDTLRELLKPPKGAPLHLEQFAVGNSELLRLAEKQTGPDYQRYVATWIGYLLYNRVLEFPGPLVGTIAAAAYLGIAKDEIKKKDIQAQLADARYTGPFAGRGYWWVSGLDDLIAKNTEKGAKSVPTGRAVLSRLLGREVPPATCRDGEELDEQAFLCVLTRDIVCRRHSDAPEAWIPQGADLCRIHTEEFDALRAWLGI